MFLILSHSDRHPRVSEFQVKANISIVNQGRTMTLFIQYLIIPRLSHSRLRINRQRQNNTEAVPAKGLAWLGAGEAGSSARRSGMGVGGGGGRQRLWRTPCTLLPAHAADPHRGLSGRTRTRAHTPRTRTLTAHPSSGKLTTPHDSQIPIT